MGEIKQQEIREHLLVLKNRKSLTISGINEVESFDDSSVILKTVFGELLIEGEELHISELDTARGAVAVDGNIQSLTYYESKPEERKGRFGRFLR